MKKNLALLFTVIFSDLSFATLENPSLLPFGEREVLTGNAGVAGTPSSGAVVYNPAGLALLKHSSLSVSGSTYLLQDVKASPLFRVDGTDEDYTASGFDSIPATVISVTRWSDWALALSVLIPEVLKLNNRISFTTPNTNTMIHQVQTTNDLWLGASLAKQLGPDWAIGLSLFGIQKSQSSTITLTSLLPATPTLANVNHTNTKSSVINVTASAGVRWHAAAYLDLGLRLRLPSLRLSGSGDGYHYLQVSNGTAQTITSKEEKKMEAHAFVPFDASLGATWHLGESVRLLTDLSLQAGARFDVYPGSTFSDVMNVQAGPRCNVGLEVDASKDLVLAAGYFYNPSTKPAAGQVEGDVRQNFSGVTGGVSWQSDRVRTGAGVFYFWSTGTFVPFNNPTGSGQFTQNGLGATLVFSYSLGDEIASNTP